MLKHNKIVRILFAITLLTAFNYSSFAQEIQWYNPEKETDFIIEGQAWTKTVKNRYDRLPASAESQVRKEVWKLSNNSAGLYISFTTDAKDIKVKYGLKERLALNQMPATGVSGVDLYALTKDNKWKWVKGQYLSFKSDTVSINFDKLYPESVKAYRIYLPLYNTPKWFEIGIDKKSTFKTLSDKQSKPIIVYGTSIAQGSSASRAGMAWTNILNRKLNVPVINLGFSGNGRLEPEITNLIAEKEASVFILDCLPNLMIFSEAEVKEKILKAVQTIRQKHKHTPIILTEHADATISLVNEDRQKPFLKINTLMKDLFNLMKKQGVKHISLLTAEEIGLDIDSTADGIHPSDLGMMQYAEAYEKLIKKITK
jgi:lysophospholipase L1-like esterase